MIHDLLSTALAQATHALGEDDAIAAAVALQEAALACESALRQGLGLEPPHLAELMSIYVECRDEAAAARRRLCEALGAAGQARRAEDAYRR